MASDISPTTVPRPRSPNPELNGNSPLYSVKQFKFDSDNIIPEYDLQKLVSVCPISDKSFLDSLLQWQQTFKDLHYSPVSSIHDKSAVSFYKFVLNCNPLVLDTLLYGYKPVFHTPPESSYERNNKTARADMNFVRDEVKKLVQKEAVVRLDYKPFVVSPLTVSSRTDCITNITKKRFFFLFKFKFFHFSSFFSAF